VLGALPKSLRGKAKADLLAIWMAPTRREASQALKRFISRDDAESPQATETLEKDHEALLAFFAFPADHGVHRRTTHTIESTFATVRHRTRRTKNGVTRTTVLGPAFKMSEEAAKTWRRIRAPEKVAELLGGARHEDGIPVPDDPPETHEEQREPP
jgi:transposase-like protein